MLSNLSATRLCHMCMIFHYLFCLEQSEITQRSLGKSGANKNCNRHEHISSDPRPNIHTSQIIIPQSCIPQLYVQSFLLQNAGPTDNFGFGSDCCKSTAMTIELVWIFFCNFRHFSDGFITLIGLFSV